MQDRLKFRYFFDKENKVFDVVSIDFVKKQIDLWLNDTTCIHIDDFDDKNLVQCTGLKDKNGKLIFEGDIVDITTEIETIAKIEWSDDLARFVILFEDIIADFDNYNSTELEIIGNFYEDEEYRGCFL